MLKEALLFLLDDFSEKELVVEIVVDFVEDIVEVAKLEPVKLLLVRVDCVVFIEDMTLVEEETVPNDTVEVILALTELVVDVVIVVVAVVVVLVEVLVNVVVVVVVVVVGSKSVVENSHVIFVNPTDN